MAPIAQARSGDDSNKRFRMGMKGFMVVVAACTLIVWAGASIREYLVGPQALRAVRAGNVTERIIAVQALADQRGIDADEAFTAIIHRLHDEDDGVRAAAARSLGSFVYKSRAYPVPASGPDPLKRRIDIAMRVLVPLLSDRDPGVRAAAAAGVGLAARGPSPTPPVHGQLAAIWDEPNAARRQAVKKVFGAPDVPVMPELVAALQDESGEVRTAAAQALIGFGPDLDPAIPSLITTLERHETNVHEACARALHEAWPSPAIVPALLRCLQSKDREVRYYAAQLLGRIGPEASAATPTLITILNEPHPRSELDPACAAAQALGQMGPRPEAIASLLEVFSPAKVEAYLAAYQKAASSPLEAKSSTELPRDFIWQSFRIQSAAVGLSHIGPPAVAAVPALIAAYDKALEAHHWMGHTTFPAALGRIAPHTAAAPDAVAALIRALDSNDSPFYLGAVEALGQFGKDGTPAIPRLQALWQNQGPVHDAAAKSLAALGAR
jgi:HEAT repeat protein